MGGRTTLTHDSVEQSRQQFEGIFAGLKPMLPPPTDAIKTEEVEFQPGKKLRIYSPSAPEEKLPVGLYIHSGGWYTGSIDAEDFLCRTIAEKCGMILFSPDYQLAPENPHPAGLNDVSAAYEYMHNSARSHGGNAGQKFIMGGSAGGNLTACVALKYASHTDLRPSGLIIACPTTCHPDARPAEYKQRYQPDLYADSPTISNELVYKAWEWYGAAPTDPLASPLLHPDIKLLPPTYVAACTKDPLHQDTVFFYEECKRKGVDVDLIEWVGYPHFFWILPMLQRSKEFLDEWCEHLSGMVAKA